MFLLKRQEDRQQKEEEEMQRKILLEERRILIAHRKLETIRLLSELFDRIKVIIIICVIFIAPSNRCNCSVALYKS